MQQENESALHSTSSVSRRSKSLRRLEISAFAEVVVAVVMVAVLIE